MKPDPPILSFFQYGLVLDEARAPGGQVVEHAAFQEGPKPVLERVTGKNGRRLPCPSDLGSGTLAGAVVRLMNWCTVVLCLLSS